MYCAFTSGIASDFILHDTRILSHLSKNNENETKLLKPKSIWINQNACANDTRSKTTTNIMHNKYRETPSGAVSQITVEVVVSRIIKPNFPGGCFDSWLSMDSESPPMTEHMADTLRGIAVPPGHNSNVMSIWFVPAQRVPIPAELSVHLRNQRSSKRR